MSTTYETLYDAIREHSGMDRAEIIEAGEHGADAGWPGFTYYAETGEFYEENKAAIWELAAEMADSIGLPSVPALVATFKCCEDCGDPDIFANCLAWFALEEVGRWAADNAEEEASV